MTDKTHVLLKPNNVIGDEILYMMRDLSRHYHLLMPYFSLWKALVTEMPSVLLALVPLGPCPLKKPQIVAYVRTVLYRDMLFSRIR